MPSSDGERIRPRLGPSVLLSPVDDGYLAFEVHTRRLHHLNPTAALLVELCDGSRPLDELRDALLPIVGNQEWQACAAWIDRALEDQLLFVGAPPPAWTADCAGSLATLAQELRREGRILEAFVCQQQAAQQSPDSPGAWYALGELAHILGRRADARAAYERYAERHPDDAEIALILTALRDDAPPPRASTQSIEQLYSRFASFYDSTMSGDLQYRAPELLSDALVRACGDRHDLRVLDLGCGTGLVGGLLRERAARLVGVDLSPQMIAHARGRRLYDALHADEITAWLSRLPDREDSVRWDVILACDALIYFGDLRQVVAPAAPLLTPLGLMGFTVEQGDTRPFRLSDSGRFTHHKDHIIDVALEAGLSIVSLEEGVLRYEYGEPVRGLVVVLRA